MCKLFSCLLVAVSLCTADNAADIAAAERAFDQASNARNVAELEGMLTTDFLFITRNGRALEKQAYVSDVKSGRMATNIKREAIKVRLTGVSLAVPCSESCYRSPVRGR